MAILINIGEPRSYKYRIVEKENAAGGYKFQAQCKNSELFSSWENCRDHKISEEDAYQEILKDIRQRQEFRNKWNPKIKRVIKIKEIFKP